MKPPVRFQLGMSVLTIVTVVAVIALRSIASAGPATPAEVPASECKTSPIAAERLIEIASSDFEPTRSTVAQTLGTPASDGTIAAIEAVVRESIACVNANQPMRVFALFTEGYLRERFGGENADDLGHLLAATTREPHPADEQDLLKMVAVDDVQLFDSGRVRATVITANATTIFTDRIEFVRVDDGWRIDRVEFVDATAIDG